MVAPKTQEQQQREVQALAIIAQLKERAVGVRWKEKRATSILDAEGNVVGTRVTIFDRYAPSDPRAAALVLQWLGFDLAADSREADTRSMSGKGNLEAEHGS